MADTTHVWERMGRCVSETLALRCKLVSSRQEVHGEDAGYSCGPALRYKLFLMKFKLFMFIPSYVVKCVFFVPPTFQGVSVCVIFRSVLPFFFSSFVLFCLFLVSTSQVSYMAQRSVEDSLSVEAGENAWVLIVSYLLMFVYVSLVLGEPCHPVRY